MDDIISGCVSWQFLFLIRHMIFKFIFMRVIYYTRGNPMGIKLDILRKSVAYLKLRDFLAGREGKTGEREYISVGEL